MLFKITNQCKNAVADNKQSKDSKGVHLQQLDKIAM